MLDVLVCPACKGALEPVASVGTPAAPETTTPESLAGLDCPACRLRFPIVEDIPVMLIDQATRIPA